MNGRIWFCWNPQTVQAKVVREHEQAIHCEVLDVATSKIQNLIAVYGLNTSEQRNSLWSFVCREIQ